MLPVTGTTRQHNYFGKRKATRMVVFVPAKENNVLDCYRAFVTFDRIHNGLLLLIWFAGIVKFMTACRQCGKSKSSSGIAMYFAPIVCSSS